MDQPSPDALGGLRADLVAEQEALDGIVASAAEDGWRRATDSPGWTVADQIAHLTYFDDTAALAITDPDRFTEDAKELAALFSLGPQATDEATVGRYRGKSPAELLAAWRSARAKLAAAAATLSADDRVVWYGPTMGARSFLTARLMEVWAHGADIAKALGIHRKDTDRLRHIVTLGVMTRGWSYINRGMTPPDVAVRVELSSPSGQRWTFGPQDAAESVTGSAAEFCSVVTQRAHVDDTALVVHGPAARDWMLRAQCFAGPATDGPAARSLN